MLINHENVPYIFQEKLIWLTNWNVGDIWDFTDTDYYAVQFLDPMFCNTERFTEAIPADIVAKIKNKEIVLALSNQLEAFYTTIDMIYKSIVIDLGIPEEQILLLTGCPVMLSRLKDKALEYNKKEFKVGWCRMFEYTVALQEFFVIKSPKIDRLHKKFNKKFICLNRRWRPHRAAFVGLLASKNLLDHGYVSLGDCEGSNWKDIYPLLIELNSHNSEFRSVFENNKDTILGLKNLHVDTNNLEVNMPEFRPELSSFYADTFFSIVTETPFYDDHIGVLLSEKIFKPITQRHPFLMLNAPYALRMLRSVGYKTFHPFIDESYDDEVDNSKRLMMILRETEKLCRMSDNEVSDFIEQTEKICEHNYNNLVKFMELNFHNKEFKLSTKYSNKLN